MRAPLVVLTLSLVALSCGGSSLLLKPPLMAGCQKAGLPKCSELADGVIEYIDGDKDKARASLHNAVAGVEPAKVQAVVLLLKSLPSSKELDEVIAILEGTSPPSGPGAPSAGEAATTSSTAASAGTEVSGFTHLRAATVLVPGNPQTRNCSALLYAGAVPLTSLCLRAEAGPLVITDLEWSESCPAETFALTGDPDQPIWFLRSAVGHAYSMHGGALIVPAGASFTVGHRLTSGFPLPTTASCAITWAGRRP